jgi:two-component sensor histidine kinase
MKRYMYEFDFLRAIQEQIRIFREFPLPVIICNREFHVYWSNDLARRFYPHVTETEGLRGALAEQRPHELFLEAEKSGNCTVREVFPFSDVNMSITPIPGQGEAIGMALVFMRANNPLDPGGFHQTSHMASALADSIRDAVSNVFEAMDITALKGDFLNAGWVRAGLSDISGQNYRILRIASNISEFARYQSGLLGLAPEEGDMTALLAELRDAVLPFAESLNIPIAFDLPEAPVYLRVDTERFEWAFYNILHNSFYYTRPGNRVTVSLSEEPGEERVTVTVSDRGLGIPESIVSRVASPYFAYDHDSPHTSGAGLGLTVAHLLCEAHGGGLRVRPRDGGGAEAQMSFPAGPAGLRAHPLRQQTSRFRLHDRFSPFYIGLSDTAASPHTR